MDKPMHAPSSGIEFVASIFIMASTKVLENANHLYELHIPPVIMETLQAFAWIAIGVTGAITVLKYLGYKPKINWNLFKKK